MTDSSLPGHMPNGDLPAAEGLETPEFLAALLADGDDELAAWVVGRALGERPRAEVYDELVRPAMALVGERWEKGEWSISVEHLATVALTGALSRLRPADDPETRIGPTAILAAPEQEHHTAGLLCLAQVLEDAGWHVENLGANVPAGELARFAAGRSVDLVALSIGIPERLPALQAAIDALRADPATAALPVMVGGNGVAGAAKTIRGASLVAGSLAEAEAYAVSLAPADTGE
jgi:MerR family transcriptional regulator, light-induced transcriptional regulator